MRGNGKLSICISSKSRSLKSSSCFTYLVWQRSPHLLFSFCILSVTRCWSPELLCSGKLNCSPLPPVSPKPSRLVGAIGVCRLVSFSVLKNSCSSIFLIVPFGVGREKTLTVDLVVWDWRHNCCNGRTVNNSASEITPWGVLSWLDG